MVNRATTSAPALRPRTVSVIVSVLVITPILGILFLIPQSSYATFPGTNGKIAFSDNGKILAVDPDGTNLVPLTNGTFEHISSPKWSHDGTKIVFDLKTGVNSDIFVLNLVDGHITNLTSDDRAQYPSWSNDSTRIVFDRDAQVYTINADGTNMALLSSVSPSTTYPDWSPDGSKIAFVNGGYVAVMNADGTDFRNISTEGGQLDPLFPSWSPDGSKVAFYAVGALYVVNSDGTGLTKLLDNARHASWSPDGTMFTFTRYNATSQSEIHVMNVDGSGLVNLGISGDHPDWGVSSSVILPPPFNGPPVVTGTVDRPPDSNGYYNHEILITWSGSDSDGVAFCDEPMAIAGPNSPPATDGTDNSLTFTGHCVDKLGNEGTGSIKIRYDSREPEISSPQQGKTFLVGQDVNTEFTCSDASSGIQTCAASTPKLDTSSEGPGSYLVTATDVAGNTEELTVNYTVFSQSTYTLTINALANSDNSPLRMWILIRTGEGIVQTGFTPLTFIANAGSTYVVTASDYQSIIFSNWEDGSTFDSRAFKPASDINATAYYDAGSTLRGFTSLTYIGTSEQPDLTVEALSLADGHSLRMWTHVTAGPTTAEGTQYAVTVHNYQDRVFDHWEDGSTSKTRTVTITELAAITAYYNTG